jgi:methionyl-tRNA formyltransferase
MGTPDFAVPCLERLVAANHEVVAVVTQPDRPKGRGQKLTASPVKEAAIKYGLPVLQPEKIKEPGFIEQLAALKPDIIVVVAFGQFLPKILLELPPLGCINVHASLLPYYRGAAPIHWAVINGEKVTGVTTMYMDLGMDTGDMILKAETAIGGQDTSGELHDRLMEMGAELLIQTVAAIANGTAPRTKQDNSQATYAPLLKRDTELIDWGKPAQSIHNLIRGLNPWPGAYCRHRDKILKVWRSELLNSSAAGRKPGELVAVGDKLAVATGQGMIILREVQPESKRRMAAEEYMRGYSVNAGEVLY